MRTITGLEELKAAEGETLGTSEWHEVTQRDVERFFAVVAVLICPGAARGRCRRGR